MPNKRYRQQTSHEDSDGRSSSQSPSSNGKHNDPLDFRPAENSPMMGHGGRTYEEHDLWLYDYQIEERRSVWNTGFINARLGSSYAVYYSSIIRSPNVQPISSIHSSVTVVGGND